MTKTSQVKRSTRSQSSRGNATMHDRGLACEGARGSVSPLCVGFECPAKINWRQLNAACDKFFKSRGLDVVEYADSWGWGGRTGRA
jgi:hypothetical protein